MVGFSELLVQRLHSQAELLKSLTQHSTLVGSGREGAFRELLRELLPRRLEVLEGTVAGPVGPDGPSRTKRQVDCMLVDTFTYPTLLRSGNLAVVLHHAVRAIIASGDGPNPASCGHVKSGQSLQDVGRVARSTSVLQVGL